MNATSYDWQQAPAASRGRQQPPVTLARALLWTAALLLAYCVYEQLSFWTNRCCESRAQGQLVMPPGYLPSHVGMKCPL